MSQLLSALPVGSLIKDTGTQYDNHDLVFQVLEHGHSGDPAGSTAICTKDIICYKPFSSYEYNDGGMTYAVYTPYTWRYQYCALRQWLSAFGANWYVPNTKDSVTPNYASENGFLSNISDKLRAKILTSTKSQEGTSVSGLVHIMSGAELAGSGSDGSIYELFSTTPSARIKKRLGTDTVGIYHTTKRGSAFYTQEDLYSLCCINTSGNIHQSSYFFTPISGGEAGSNPANSKGIVPQMCVDSSILVSDQPDQDGVYTIVWNQTPTINPATTDYGSVTTPPAITTTITDPDGDSFTYTVKLNGVTKDSGSATGTKTFAVDTTTYWPLMALGTNTITVQATDSHGATASATYTMNKTNSAAPVPTTDLVNNTRKETSFYIGFQIGLDADGDSQTVVAQVSDSSDMSDPTEFTGVEKLVSGAWLPVQTLTNADVGASLRIQVTGQTVGDTIYVRLKDTDSGSGSPVYTSTYAIVIGSVLEFDTLPISRTEKPSLVVAYLNKTMPADATLTMYACNNANDGAPAWEAITEGETHQFTNKTKTAANWGVSVKTSIAAGATAGEISVSAVGLGVL